MAEGPSGQSPEKMGSNETQGAVGDVKIEDGRILHYGSGAEGEKWYNIGAADEEVPNQFGNHDGTTAAQAYEKGLLRVDEKTGQPYVDFEAKSEQK